MNTIVLTTLVTLTSVVLILYINSIINSVAYFQTLKLRDETIKLAEKEAAYYRLLAAEETEDTKAVNDAYKEALDLLK